MTAQDRAMLPESNPAREREAARLELRRRVIADYSPTAGSLDRIERRAVAAFRNDVRQGRFAESPHPRQVGRLAAAVLAAAFIVAGSAAVASAASAPGRPLFGARLAVEQALLPSKPGSERIASQLAVLDRRLVEASEADGNPEAVGDATRAYRQTLSDLLRTVEAAPDQAATVEQSVLAQIAWIESLEFRDSPLVRRELDGAAVAARELLAALGRPSLENWNSGHWRDLGPLNGRPRRR